ncbi:MAG: hypothetical protein U5L75_00930 [Candidatus Campbellbacteria bacterium]|nr:hypothetical protein [Candidatus Campbellbacteria bacterium]
MHIPEKLKTPKAKGVVATLFFIVLLLGTHSLDGQITSSEVGVNIAIAVALGVVVYSSEKKNCC